MCLITPWPLWHRGRTDGAAAYVASLKKASGRESEANKVFGLSLASAGHSTRVLLSGQVSTAGANLDMTWRHPSLACMKEGIVFLINPKMNTNILATSVFATQEALAELSTERARSLSVAACMSPTTSRRIWDIG